MKLSNYVYGQWIEGASTGVELKNPVSGEILSYASSDGVDLKRALAFSREVGGVNLRKLSYVQRANLLNNIADVLLENRDKYYQIAEVNSGNTRTDARIDIDGGVGTLKYFAACGQKLGDENYLTESGKDLSLIHI